MNLFGNRTSAASSDPMALGTYANQMSSGLSSMNDRLAQAVYQVPSITIQPVLNGYILRAGGTHGNSGKEYVASNIDELCDVLKLALVNASVDKSLGSSK